MCCFKSLLTADARYAARLRLIWPSTPLVC